MTPANHREQLVGMLTEAAEIEHCLMCTYLYGAFSLKQTAEEGLTAEELATVRRWRGQVVQIAVDEMLHLALVSNLLIAVGARPHYRRFNFPIAAGLFPADVAVELSPLDEACLDHFIYLERPREVQEHDSARLHKASYKRQVMGNRLMPFADDYATVGELYEAIEASFVALDARMGRAALFAGGAAGQLTQAEFPLAGLCTITSVADACAAIHLIIHQGEGSRVSHAQSHYARFSAIRTEWQALKAARAGFVPWRPAARNPVMRSPISADRVQVIAEPASTLLDAGNACYGLMLRMLSLAADDTAFFDGLGGAAAGNGGGRRFVTQQTLTLMHALTDIGNRLTTLPANAAFAGVNAGLTFTVSRQALAFPSPVACAAILAEGLQAVAARLSELQGGMPELAPHAAAIGQAAAEWRARHHALQPAAAAMPMAAPLSAAPVAVPSLAAAVAHAEPPKVDIAKGQLATIRFDHARCIHARHCVLGEPTVFKANTPGEWIYPDTATPERIAIVAHNCPSGAITFRRHDGGSEEVFPLVNLARVRENGPLAFHGQLQIAGAPAESCDKRATLCRCGRSNNKPFCDGSHNGTPNDEAKFVASGEPVTQASESLAQRDGPLSIAPQKNGPLLVTGNLELCAGTGRTINRIAATAPVRLCRCGQSANKPYCDGSHRVAGFVAEGAE